MKNFWASGLFRILTALVPFLAFGLHGGLPASADAAHRAVGDSCVGRTGIVIAAQGLVESDGTVTGTRVLRAVGVPAPGAGPAGFFQLIGRAGNRAVIAAYVSGGSAFYGSAQLWATDGTVKGTGLIKAFPFKGQGPDSINALFQVPQRLVLGFSDTPGYDQEIWTTDGTKSGTGRIRTNFAAAYSRFYSLDHSARLSDGLRVHVTQRGLEVSGEGSGESTLLLSFANGADIVGLGSSAVLSIRVGGDINGTGGRYQVWRTDGTIGGTNIVAALAGDAGMYSPPSFFRLAAGAGRALFAYAGALMTTDGTAAGTTTLPGITDPELGRASRLGLQAIISTPNSGLWVTDGTLAKTTLLEPAVVSGHHFAVTSSIVTVNGFGVFQVGGTGSRAELWRTDGTPAGTRLALNLPTMGTYPGILGIGSLGERALFSYYDGTSNDLWSTDGTAPGTFVVLANSNTNAASLVSLPCSVSRPFVDADVAR